MRDTFQAGVNNTWYHILLDQQLTNLSSIENFSGAKHAGKVHIIIILFSIIVYPDTIYCMQTENLSIFLPTRPG